MSEREPSGRYWNHEIRQTGHVIVGSITECDHDDDLYAREMGWHVQDSANNVVFFVPAKSCTYEEAENYVKNLRKKRFKAMCVKQEYFHKFIEDKRKELDPIFYLAASCGVPLPMKGAGDDQA